MQGVEAAFHGARPQRCPHSHRPGDSLEVFGPKILKLKETAEKSARAVGYDHHVRLSDSLQARRKVWRLADDATFLRFARSDQVADNDQPSGDANTSLQRSRRLECGHRR